MYAKLVIFTHTAHSYAQKVKAHLGRGYEHARLIYSQWYRTGKVNHQIPHFKNAHELYQKILEITDFSFLPLLKKREENATEKHLLVTKDGLEVEMVLIPMRAGYTLCVSSQIGCRMGCTFCETGKMGLLRSLSTKEILSQVFQTKHGLGMDVRNIVFMGMGEPLDNYDSVMGAIKILTDPYGFGFGPSRITISTSGVVDKIYRLMEEADPAICLALSMNAPRDEVRNRLMPINRQYNMAALRKVMEDYTANPRRRILIEYVLIKNKTDSLEDADTLAAYLKGLQVTINLIPYNPQSRDCFEPPSLENVEEFLKKMRKYGFLTFVRSTKGQKIMAACGQLGNIALRNRKKSLVFSQESGIFNLDKIKGTS